MKSIEEVREYFAHDRFAVENGAYIEEIGDKYAKCTMNITPKHLNAMGGVMGGAIFVLADFAFAVAVNWQQASTVTLNSTVTFYGTAKGSQIIAEAKCLKDGRTTCCYQIEIVDDLANPVAMLMMSGFKKVKN